MSITDDKGWGEVERRAKRHETSWVYVRAGSWEGYSLWTVGFYSPDGTWHPESDHSSSETAAKRVNYLNGAQQ